MSIHVNYPAWLLCFPHFDQDEQLLHCVTAMQHLKRYKGKFLTLTLTKHVIGAQAPKGTLMYKVCISDSHIRIKLSLSRVLCSDHPCCGFHYSIRP